MKLDVVTNQLEKLDTSEDAGPDNISAHLLVRCAPSVALPIYLLFIKPGTVPTLWKSAFIKPVHKQDSKTEIANYSPIYKLCIIAKVFERIVYNQLNLLSQTIEPFLARLPKGPIYSYQPGLIK